MAVKPPEALTETSAETGVKKAGLSWDKALVASFLAGAYIAFGALLAVVVSSGLDEERWGGLVTLATGSVFSLGLILVVIAGSELLTGNMMLVPLAAFERRVGVGKVLRNFALITFGNFLGAIFIAYFMAYATGIITEDAPLARLEQIATLKAIDETEFQIFLRATGANWLVCLAVWMALAADDVAGKILAIFFPIMGFVALGFDHVVANFFFLPAAIFAGAGDIGWDDAARNWLFAGLGNLVGAAVFVAGTYWYLYARDDGGGEAGDDTAARENGRAGQAAPDRGTAVS